MECLSNNILVNHLSYWFNLVTNEKRWNSIITLTFVELSFHRYVSSTLLLFPLPPPPPMQLSVYICYHERLPNPYNIMNMNIHTRKHTHIHIYRLISWNSIRRYLIRILWYSLSGIVSSIAYRMNDSRIFYKFLYSLRRHFESDKLKFIVQMIMHWHCSLYNTDLFIYLPRYTTWIFCTFHSDDFIFVVVVVDHVRIDLAELQTINWQMGSRCMLLRKAVR